VTAFLLLPEYLDHIVVTQLLHELVNSQLMVKDFLPLDVALVGDNLFVLVEVNGRRIGSHGDSQAAGDPKDKGIIHDL